MNHRYKKKNRSYLQTHKLLDQPRVMFWHTLSLCNLFDIYQGLGIIISLVKFLENEINQTYYTKLHDTHKKLTIQDKKRQNPNLEEHRQPWGIGVTRNSEAMLLKSKICGSNVSLFKHRQLFRAPCKVRSAISSVHLLRQLWCKIQLHRFNFSLKPQRSMTERAMKRSSKKVNV